MVVTVVVLALLGAAVTVGVLASQRDTGGGGGGGGGAATGDRAVPSTVAIQPLPGTAFSVPPTPGIELTLLAGRLVVAARPGWEGLESAEDNASVRLVLNEPTGRKLLSTLTIVTLSSPESFDSTLKLEGGTSFEVKRVDGPLRVTVRPGPTARIVAGADRPKGAFFINVSIFTADGKDIDVATLQSLFTDQIAPALRFP